MRAALRPHPSLGNPAERRVAACRLFRFLSDDASA